MARDSGALIVILLTKADRASDAASAAATVRRWPATSGC